MGLILGGCQQKFAQLNQTRIQIQRPQLRKATRARDFLLQTDRETFHIWQTIGRSKVAKDQKTLAESAPHRGLIVFGVMKRKIWTDKDRRPVTSAQLPLRPLQCLRVPAERGD